MHHRLTSINYRLFLSSQNNWNLRANPATTSSRRIGLKFFYIF